MNLTTWLSIAIVIVAIIMLMSVVGEILSKSTRITAYDVLVKLCCLLIGILGLLLALISIK